MYLKNDFIIIKISKGVVMNNYLIKEIKNVCSNENLEWYYRELKSMYFIESSKKDGNNHIFFKSSTENIIWEKSISLLNDCYLILKDIKRSSYFKKIINEIKLGNQENKFIFCEHCNQLIFSISKEEKEKKQLHDFYCNCNNEKIYNDSYFIYKKNLIIYNYIFSMITWIEEFFYISKKINNNYDNSKIIYKLRVLFEDVFMFNDTIISLMFYLNDNRIKAFSYIDQRYYNEKNKLIRNKLQNYNMEKSKDDIFSKNFEFIELLKKVSKIEKSSFDNIFNKFSNLAIFSNNLKEAFSLFRNKNTHNFLIFFSGWETYELIEKINDYLLKTAFLLLDKFFFFIFFLEIVSEI